jgi:hypothetical protein
LGGAGPTECPASTAFRNDEDLLRVPDRLPSSYRATRFPETVSRNMALSRERSATCVFGRPFPCLESLGTLSLVGAQPAILLAPPTVGLLVDAF